MGMLAQVFLNTAAAQNARHLAIRMDEATRAFPAVGGAVHIYNCGNNARLTLGQTGV
nr:MULTISPECIES: hypothetical protein [Paenibacillus]